MDWCDHPYRLLANEDGPTRLAFIAEDAFQTFSNSINPPVPPGESGGSSMASPERLAGDTSNFLLILFIPPTPLGSTRGERKVSPERPVGDTGFEPVTPTVCRKQKLKRRRRKQRDFPRKHPFSRPFGFLRISISIDSFRYFWAHFGHNHN